MVPVAKMRLTTPQREEQLLQALPGKQLVDCLNHECVVLWSYGV